MARKYANLITAMWRSEEWRALSGDEQRMYMLLNTQPDISAAGVLHLSITRWSAMARNTPPEAVITALEGLVRGRFVIYDTRTEELLVRSFVRWDGGHTNSKRRPVIRDAAQEVISPHIRRALAYEFQRLGLPDWLPDALSDAISTSDTPSSTTPGPVPDEEPKEIADELFALGNGLSDSPSDAISPSERVVVTKGLYLEPQPTTHNPQPPPSVPPPPEKPQTVTQRSKRITDEYAKLVKLSNWPAINGIVVKAVKAEQWTDDEITQALLRMAGESRTVTVDSLRVELEGLAPRASPRSQLVEVNGMHLKPANVEAIARQQRMAALDAKRQTTLEGQGTWTSPKQIAS